MTGYWHKCDGTSVSSKVILKGINVTRCFCCGHSNIINLLSKIKIEVDGPISTLCVNMHFKTIFEFVLIGFMPEKVFGNPDSKLV